MHPSQDFKDRTKQFAIRVMRVCKALSGNRELRPLSDQLLRSGTSVAANYRAACRGRSTAEFLSKLAVVIEEADETAFWLELLGDSGELPREKIAAVLDEARQLVRIFSASKRTTKARMKMENEKSKLKNEN
jgi:four helix bundle protein